MILVALIEFGGRFECVTNLNEFFFLTEGVGTLKNFWQGEQQVNVEALVAVFVFIFCENSILGVLILTRIYLNLVVVGGTLLPQLNQAISV